MARAEHRAAACGAARRQAGAEGPCCLPTAPSCSCMSTYWPARIQLGWEWRKCNGEDNLIIGGFAMPGPSAMASLGVTIVLPPVDRLERRHHPLSIPPPRPVCAGRSLIATDISASAAGSIPKAAMGGENGGVGSNVHFVPTSRLPLLPRGVSQGHVMDPRPSACCPPGH